MKKIYFHSTPVFFVFILFCQLSFAAGVIHKENRVFIKDRTGELWDVTQAKSIGFKPEKFEYGIGRHAFTPLDQQDLSSNQHSVSINDRVIGISLGDEAHAYKVAKLRRHEIANTTIGNQAIVASY